MVKVIESDNILNELDRYDVILVGVNCYCNLTNGFPHEVALYHPCVYYTNLRTKYADLNKLGTILECENTYDDMTFVLMFITKGYNFRPDLEKDFLSYESLEKCFKLVNILYKGKKIASSFLGSSRFDGNGDKERILQIAQECLTDCDVTFYDYFQETCNEKKIRVRKAELKIKEADREEYKKAVSERKIREKKLKEFNGFSRW